MRFELFEGPMSVGVVSWQPPGVVVLDIPDEDRRAVLVRHFGGGSARGGEGRVEIPRPDWRSGDFEAACLELDASSGILAVARPSQDDPGRRSKPR